MTDTIRRLGLLVTASAVAGLAIALLVLPLVGGLGYVAGRGADTWEGETCGLAATPPLPQRTHIVAADGSTIADFFYQNRVAVPIDRIAPVMREAIIAIEDARFYEHNGLDPKGTIRALVTNGRSGSIRQGGSTLTQQYVKNLQLLAARTKAQQRAAVADTVERKLREAHCALALERKLSKDEILAGYLNIALFGPGIYGIEAASERYYDRPARQLTLAQAALLAGLVKNPAGYDPVRHRAAAFARRNTVLERMREVGFITERERAHAAHTRLRLHVTTIRNGCEASRAPYFCEWVLHLVRDDPAFGETQAERVNALLRGGLTIQTTLDWKTQRAADAAVRRYVPPRHKRNPRRIAAASVVVKPGTGAVEAMAVNLPFGNVAGQNANNLATGGSTGFQAGSTFKLFTLLTALEQGIPQTFTLNAPQTYCSHVFPDYRCDGGRHGVSNAGDSEHGRFTLLQATADSVNTYFVQLEERVGVEQVAATAQRLGVDFTAFPGERQPTAVDGSLTLGTWGVSPLTMASAYATVAARGRYCVPYGLTAARSGEGHELDIAGPQCRQAVAQPVADTAAQILTHVACGHRSSGRGQDRDDDSLRRGLVRRVHPPAGGGGLGRRPAWTGAPVERLPARRPVLAQGFRRRPAGGDLGCDDAPRARRRTGGAVPAGRSHGRVRAACAGAGRHRRHADRRARRAERGRPAGRGRGGAGALGAARGHGRVHVAARGLGRPVGHDGSRLRERWHPATTATEPDTDVRVTDAVAVAVAQREQPAADDRTADASTTHAADTAGTTTPLRGFGRTGR
jgi:membrane peptidoglycan carboxypeptidase